MDLIDQIEASRRRNNIHWMELLRIAYEADPERTKEVLRQIQTQDDAQIQLLRELAE